MFFNSLDFALFLPTVFFLYWIVAKNKTQLQNIIIVLSSYVFYGWWDWRFLPLIFISTVIDYTVGLKLSNTKNPKSRKILLLISILANLGFLGFFKYYNFFVESFISAFSFFGITFQVGTLHIVLPVGISFYTFQTLSYSIDVYKKKLLPTKNFIEFAAFVSFFPQLVAGPIERAAWLLPQFHKKRHFNYQDAVIGSRQMLWGFVKKIIIADNCAKYVNIIFANYASYSGSTLLLGAVFFAFQIYSDFSGYSDIAIGTAKLFGFDLMKNFAFPYFSRDISEFWRRWHISLSTWFRDYLYIPLGGSRGGTWMKIRNTFIIFIVSGFWHGANWTFVVWGLLNAIYFLPLLLSHKNRVHIEIVAKNKLLPSIKEIVQIFFTFGLTVIAWVFFRSPTVKDAFRYIQRIFSPSLFSLPVFSGRSKALTVVILVFLFVLIEWLGRDKEYAIEEINYYRSPALRYVSTFLIILSIAVFGNFGNNAFIYFQF